MVLEQSQIGRHWTPWTCTSQTPSTLENPLEVLHLNLKVGGTLYSGTPLFMNFHLSFVSNKTC